MDPISPNKTNKARLAGAGFFILLALVYVGFEVWFNAFSTSDLAILALAFLPFLTSKRLVSFLFGSATFLATTFIGFAFVIAHLKSTQDYAVIPAESWMFAVGYLIIFLSFCASLLLMYSALSISEKRFSLI